MIRGLETNLKPFIKKIILQDLKGKKPNDFSQLNFYYGQNKSSDDYEINFTMDFCIKGYINNLNRGKSLSTLEQIKTLNLEVFTLDNKQQLTEFISLTQENKNNFIRREEFKSKKIPILQSSAAINDYISILQLSTRNQMTLNIPVQVEQAYNKNISKNNKNPNFLAIVYFLSNEEGQIIDQTASSEIIFNDSSLFEKTGYFIIDDSFSFQGRVEQLITAEVNVKTDFINQYTGESLNPNRPTDRNKQVNYLFGAPGDTWVGAVHAHPVSNPRDPNFGKVRFMAGGNHSQLTPHPFLKLVTKKNNKIIDFRSANNFEDALSYKSPQSDSLSKLQNVIYTQQKNINKPIDQFISNKSVLSNAKFSIRPIKRQQGTNPSKTKDNVILFFTIDKKKLLAQTTTLPVLLEKLIEVDSSFYGKLISLMRIKHFQIIRINNKTGESKNLIIGTNDNSFNDNKALNRLGQNVSKGFSLINKTNDIFIENGNDLGQLSSYEFTDGEIDAYHDNNDYCYEIKLKFRDPLISYLTTKLNQLNKIIYDLDDLMQKTNSLIKDPQSGKLVKVYDTFQKQLNSTFVSQSLNPSSRSLLPLNFSFNSQSELPDSVDSAFAATTDGTLSDLASFYVAMSLTFKSSGLVYAPVESVEIEDFINFVRSSLRLSTTSPTLIEKNRSLMFLLRSRVENFINYFSTLSVTKKTIGFSTKDFINSSRQRQPNNLEDSKIIEFSYKFNNSIDLSKVKNYFNWIEEPRHIGSTGGFKQINSDDYKRLVENDNIDNFLTADGRRYISEQVSYDYSFLPYSSPAVLNFQNNDKRDVDLNHLQTLRKSLIDNVTNSPQSIVVPEILSTFGIKFLNPKKEKEQSSYFSLYISDDRGYAEGEIPINSSFEDNFGTSFSSVNKITSEEYKLVNQNNILPQCHLAPLTT